MATTKKKERIIFRSTTRVWKVDRVTGERVNGFQEEEYLPSSYVKYDEKTGHPVQVVYHLVQEFQGGKARPKPEPIILKNGHLEIRPGQEALLRFLEEHPNLSTEENKRKGYKALFERVNIVKEKVNEVMDADLIVKAFNLLTTTPPKDLVMYGKSLGIETIDVEDVLRDNLKEKELKEILKSDEWASFIIDMKTHAKSSTESFIAGISNPLNKPLSLIAEAVALDVITFDSKGYTYGWKAGNDMLPIKQLPEGVEKEKWFAQWLAENPTTMAEIESRIDLAKTAQSSTAGS